ncbi:WcbI family polysaccharide biosynthesis putative acetyltransferase [Sulfurimonas sp.]|uniref:WcbI family polysaccharide biosynthesis putative acetyltransferase n=1 Tax=Sulfurimonas sp. TaxID=2022749 RepID=UPI003D0E63FB
MKEKTTVIVLGNCQTACIKRFLRINLKANLEFYEVPAIYTIVNDTERIARIANDLNSVDYIITQPLTDKFGPLALDVLRKKYPLKVIVFPVIYWNVYNLELFYLKDLNGQKITNSIVDYHDIVVLYAFVYGYTIDDLDIWFNDKDLFDNTLIKFIEETSLSELSSREKECDITASDIILSLKEKSFYTLNHPNNQVLNKVSEGILKKKYDFPIFENVKEECLSGTQFPTYKSITNYFHFSNENQNVILNNTQIKRKGLLEKYFDYYKNIDSQILIYNLEFHENSDNVIGHIIKRLKVYLSKKNS